MDWCATIEQLQDLRARFEAMAEVVDMLDADRDDEELVQVAEAMMALSRGRLLPIVEDVVAALDGGGR